MEKIEKLMNIDFNTKTTYGDDDDDKYIKTKIKTYKDSITTNFYNKNGSEKIPEEKVPHKCLSIIILDSVIYAYEKYYPQIFLEECKKGTSIVSAFQKILRVSDRSKAKFKGRKPNKISG